MNKKDIIKVVAERLDFTQKDVTSAIDTFIDAIVETLGNGADVTISGLGKFVVKEQAARTARNPRTGDSIEVAAKRVPKFKAASSLKVAVAGA